MGGETFRIVLFFVGTGVAAGVGASRTTGWRSRIFWGAMIICGVAALSYYEAASSNQPVEAYRTIWSLAPALAIALSLLAVTGREPRKPKRAVNPALTPEYLNDLVAGVTQAEAKRRIRALQNRRAKFTGQVRSVSEGYGVLSADIAGLTTKYGDWWLDTPECMFRLDQAAVLKTIKPYNWIEFVGVVVHSPTWGWALKDCEFVAHADPPESLHQ